MQVPSKACDCHVHVFGPPARYPFAGDRAYTPAEASVEELLALQERLRFERVVIVQPSVYGADNACLLDALGRVGPRARGVAMIDSRTRDEDLQLMKRTGVRGVRVNLQTGGSNDPALIAETATRVARSAGMFRSLRTSRSCGNSSRWRFRSWSIISACPARETT